MSTQISQWIQEDPRFEFSLLMKPHLVQNDVGGRVWEHEYTLRVRDDKVSKRVYSELKVDSAAIEQALAGGEKPIVAALCAMSAQEESELFALAPTFKTHYEAMALHHATQPAAGKPLPKGKGPISV